jgi:type IV fimbrial biogenesis protein FimT
MFVVVAILAILLGLMIPSYGNFSRTARLSGLSNDLVASLAFARTASIQRGVRVTICKTTNAASVNPTCQSSAKWSDGWIIFTDNSISGVVDGTDTLLRAHPQPVSGASVTVSNFTTHISYLATGRSRAPNGLANGSINFCKEGDKRSIILNVTGRVRTSKGVY